VDLLEFARGPGLWVSLAVFVLGTAWRLFGILRLPALPDLSAAREGAPSSGAAAWAGITAGLWPRAWVARARRFAALNAYVFHVGLALIFFGYAPHIDFIRRLIGFGWPALPDVVMVLASGVTLVSLMLALWFRLTDPVRRLLGTADDTISWTLVFLPMITGMALLGTPSAQVLGRAQVIYAGPLAVHLLTLEALLIWFPFGKLMHAVLFAFSRAATGIRFSHRGVRA
jgi:nitrate reductase gamma subunit